MISVVVPLFNKQREIGRCIESLLAQTHYDFEAIIVDDGCTDQSVGVVRNYSDPRLKLVQQSNTGLAGARNRGISEAGSDLIAFLDADDEWLPTHLKQLENIARQVPEAGLYCTGYWVDRGNGWRRRVKLHNRFVRSDLRVIDYFAIPRGMTLPSASAVRKKAVESVGGFRQMFGEDIDLFMRIAASYDVAYSSQASAIWHLAADNRMCVEQEASGKLHTPGSLMESVLKIEADSSIRTEVKIRVRNYVKARERDAVVATLLQGHQGHAAELLEQWKTDYKSGDLFLEILGKAPKAILRLLNFCAVATNRLSSVFQYAWGRFSGHSAIAGEAIGPLVRRRI